MYTASTQFGGFWTVANIDHQTTKFNFLGHQIFQLYGIMHAIHLHRLPHQRRKKSQVEKAIEIMDAFMKSQADAEEKFQMWEDERRKEMEREEWQERSRASAANDADARADAIKTIPITVWVRLWPINTVLTAASSKTFSVQGPLELEWWWIFNLEYSYYT